jgi:uncharacterized protein YbaR (Trm112 family)
MHATLTSLLIWPACREPVSLQPGATAHGDEIEIGALACRAGHTYPIVRGVPRFVQHDLDTDHARTRDSFAHEWTVLYPEHGHANHSGSPNGTSSSSTRTLCRPSCGAGWCSTPAAATVARRDS